VDTNGRAIDPTDESGFGEMEFYLLSFFAAREAERIRRRTRDGMRRAAARGRPLNGRPPFGYRYDVESGSWSIDEAASPWVRRMFEDCAAGRPSRAITATLAATGVKSTRGGRWHATSVARLVKNRAYLGEYSQTVDGERHEYAIPALVEEALWRRANAALTARSGRPQNAVEVEALCRGVLYCGECGERMQVRTTHRRGVAYVYYQCGSKHPRTLAVNCGSQNHRVAEVDRAVWESVRRIVQDPDLLARAASGPKPAESGDGDRESELRSLLAKVGDREASILDLMDEGLAVQTCKDRLKRLQLERSALNEELDDVRNAAAIHSKSGQVIGLTGWRRSTSGRGSAT
jgi:site-specific DNA recombinase